MLTLFKGIHEKVHQRHVEDLEDVFHNMRILLDTYGELATSFRACSAGLWSHLRRVNHDASLEELSLLFAAPDIEDPVPFETVARAAHYLSQEYTQEYWKKVDVLSSMRVDNVDLVDVLVSEWHTSTIREDVVVDGFLTQLEVLRKDVFPTLKKRESTPRR